MASARVDKERGYTALSNFKDSPHLTPKIRPLTAKIRRSNGCCIAAMANLALKVHVLDGNVTKTLNFNSSLQVYDACRLIRDRCSEVPLGDPKDYGLYLSDEDPKKGVWLESGRSLEYYLLKDGDMLEYRRKMRPLRVRMLDGTVKTVLVDDSQPVANLLVVICSKIGISNHDEFSLLRDLPEEQKENTSGTLTLRKEKKEDWKDSKMEQLKKKLKTDDDLNWVDQSKTLREQGVDEEETLLLRRKFFYSDQNVDSRDPVQLNLLYVQARDAIINGTHPVTVDQACQFAGLQCQIQYGEHIETKHRAGFIDLRDFLPKDFTKIKGIDKKIFGVSSQQFTPKWNSQDSKVWSQEHRMAGGLSELEAKVKYVSLARSLPTYGVAFFLVKEKMKGKNKLVPRLLGVTKDSILRLNEKTKEILKTWPLTTVKRWAASPNSFTLNVSRISETTWTPTIQYRHPRGNRYPSSLPATLTSSSRRSDHPLQLSVHSSHPLVMQKKARDHLGIEGDDGSTLVEDSVSPAKATILQHHTPAQPSPVDSGSLAKPAVVRPGVDENSTVMLNSLISLLSFVYVFLFSMKMMYGESLQDGNVLLLLLLLNIMKKKLNYNCVLNASIKEQLTEHIKLCVTVEKPFGMGQVKPVQHGKTTGQVHAGVSPFQAQHPQMHKPLSEPQRALRGTISTGQEAIVAAQVELEAPKPQFAEMGTDPASLQWRQSTRDVKTQNVASQLGAMNAATAQVITLTSGPPEEVDHPRVGAAISTITTNLPEMAKDVKMIAALMDDSIHGDRLLDAARNLCFAFSDLLTAAEPETKEPRQNLLNAASRVGEATHAVLHQIGEPDPLDQEIQDMLLSLAKRVANATGNLVLKAKSAAPHNIDPDRLIAAATQCALATSQLVACAKVVAPTISNPACQQQMVEATKEVSRAVETCQVAADGDRDTEEAGTKVNEALVDLLNYIRLIPDRYARRSTPQYPTVDTIFDASDRLFSSTGNATEMVRQANILAKATTDLISSIKGEAEDHQADSDRQKRLLTAAKILADATARMVEAAKGCASNPHDSQSQEALRRAAQELRNATNVAASNALKRKLITRLEAAAKHAAAMATQNIAAAQGARSYNMDQLSQNELHDACKEVVDVIPRVVQGIKATASDVDNPSSHLQLIHACEQFLLPCTNMVSASRAALPTIQDQSCSLQLSSASRQMAEALAELRSALGRAREVCGVNQEIEEALKVIRELEVELTTCLRAAHSGSLRPLPGETAETCALQLGAVSKVVGSAMAQLLTAAAQGNENYTGIAAWDTANALKILTKAVRGVAATADEPQLKLLDAGREVLEQASHLVEEARDAVRHPSPDVHSRLTSVAKSVSSALNACISCLPGQRDVDEAIRLITSITQELSITTLPHGSPTPYSELQLSLSRAAAQLNEASSDVVTAANKASPTQLASTARLFGQAYSHLLDTGVNMAGHTKDGEVRSRLVSSLKNVSLVSSKLLIAAKSYAADPSAPNAKTNLSAAARSVTEAINQLVDICTSAAPGQTECENAIRRMQALRPLLDNPTEPLSEATYFECLDSVVERSKSLGDAMTHLTTSARQGDRDQFCHSVRSTADSICSLAEAGAQAAYLVGVADPSSVAGRMGLVDPGQLSRAAEAIQSACHQLCQPGVSQHQVLSAATVIAKHTSALCNSGRTASSKTTNPVAKRHFIQSSKDVASKTGLLVKEIKALDFEPDSEEIRRNIANATRPLLDAVDNMCLFGSSPEFASVPAKMGSSARASQEPLTSAARAVVDGGCRLVGSAKNLVVNPRDPPGWQQLANHCRDVSDNIKHLVANIRDKAPGQKECEDSLSRINSGIRELDKASVNIISQSLSPQPSGNIKGLQEQMEMCSSEILEKIDHVRHAAKSEAERLGHSVNQLANMYQSLVRGAVDTASRSLRSRQQLAVLEQTKTVGECCLQLLTAAKEAGGNLRARHLHPELDTSAENARVALSELQTTLETAASETGMVTGLVETINKSIVKVPLYIHVEEYHYVSSSSVTMGESFVEYQTRMVSSCKDIAKLAQDMISKSGQEHPQLSPLAARLSHLYSGLAGDTRGAVAAAPSPELGTRVRSLVQDLGTACIRLTKAAGGCQGEPGDPFWQREVVEHGRSVAEGASYVMAALQSGARGTQACISAAATLAGIIGDLETTAMFASSGTLTCENEGDVFEHHRELMLRTAKALVEDTKALVSGAAGSQEQLAMAAQNATQTILQLAEVVKLGAASLGSTNPEAQVRPHRRPVPPCWLTIRLLQVMLLNSVKDVAISLRELVESTKMAAGKPLSDPAMVHLKESAKVMVTNITSLLKTIKAVEDEHSRGTRALESTIEAIGQEIRAFDSSEQPRRGCTAEDLVRVTKPVTLATAKAVAAGTSGKQDDIIVAANMGRKAITDLLTTAKSAAFSAESMETRHRVLSTSRECSLHYRELLQMVLRTKPGTGRQELVLMSRTIATAVTEIVTSAEYLKGSDWVDPDDPTVIAETELLGAANSIDAAARKLANLKPRRPSVKEADEALNFDEMILEAAKSITAATSALVKAASCAQRELVASGRLAPTPTDGSHWSDGQWSEGLISAARLVAAATHSLVEAANALVQGHASEEKLISSAKQVAASTAQLLVACQVKADPRSQAMKRLQAAGNAVKKATDNLVRAAQQAIEQDEERSLVINKRMVGGIAQEIIAREEILRKERELEEAREKLLALRRAKYGNEYQGYGSC
ncbi:TLN1 [Cordylochernes scorpioides]|uniref:TLN1 n=1 Tax=Cordylochernes scorpioides TaxID=51811 RepID=A0ABY6K7E8_9ARAC|nr:TLN1 [Cordylochernes scorpioides]